MGPAGIPRRRYRPHMLQGEKSQVAAGLLKLVVLVAWGAAALAFFLPADSTLGEGGRLLFWLLLVVHAIECAFFFRSLQATGNPIALELVQTMVFGVVHYTEVKAALEARAAEAAGVGDDPSGGRLD